MPTKHHTPPETDEETPEETTLSPSQKLRARGLVRITADFPKQYANLLTDLADRTGHSKVTTLLRALRVLDQLETADTRHAQLVIEEADGSKSRMLLG